MMIPRKGMRAFHIRAVLEALPYLHACASGDLLQPCVGDCHVPSAAITLGPWHAYHIYHLQ